LVRFFFNYSYSVGLAKVRVSEVALYKTTISMKAFKERVGEE